MNTATNTQNNVVNRQELLEIVYAASSQIPSQVQASTERLKSLLDNVGTYDALHEIAAEKSLPLPVRQQSIIQFKNSALSHWRSRKYAFSCPLQLLAQYHWQAAIGGVSLSHPFQMYDIPTRGGRPCALSIPSIHSSSFQLCPQIAECNEVIVAKIARLDYPHNWYAFLYET